MFPAECVRFREMFPTEFTDLHENYLKFLCTIRLISIHRRNRWRFHFRDWQQPKEMLHQNTSVQVREFCENKKAHPL
jgi:hypothetical protein